MKPIREEVAKAQLAQIISRTIKKDRLTKKQAAARIGIDPSFLAEILHGRLNDVTIDRLFRYLIRLGIDITNETKPSLADLSKATSSAKRMAIYLRY